MYNLILNFIKYFNILKNYIFVSIHPTRRPLSASIFNIVERTGIPSGQPAAAQGKPRSLSKLFSDTFSPPKMTERTVEAQAPPLKP